jgi:hypothetical protein
METGRRFLARGIEIFPPGNGQRAPGGGYRLYPETVGSGSPFLLNSGRADGIVAAGGGGDHFRRGPLPALGRIHGPGGPLLERMRPFPAAGRSAVFVGTAHMLDLKHMIEEAGFSVRRCR